MSTTGPVSGATHLLRGFAMWRRRPGLMLLGMLPALLVLLVVLAALAALLLTVDDLVSWATPFADDWTEGLRAVLRVGLGLVVVLAFLVLASVTFTGLTLAVGDPFYERIWRETEQMLGGPQPGEGLGLLRSLLDALVLMVVGLLMAVLVFVLGLLPVVGAIAGAVIGVLVSGWLLAGELLGRPLEARGFDRAARRELLRGDRGAVLGFGVATQVCFLVPLGGVAVMPAAVVGATTLARNLLGSTVAGRVPQVES